MCNGTKIYGPKKTRTYAKQQRSRWPNRERWSICKSNCLRYCFQQALSGIAPCEAVFVFPLLISLEHYVSLLGIHQALVQCAFHCVCPVVVVFTQVAQNIADNLGHVINEVKLVVVFEGKVLIGLTEVLLADEILEGRNHVDRWFIFRIAWVSHYVFEALKFKLLLQFFGELLLFLFDLFCGQFWKIKLCHLLFLLLFQFLKFLLSLLLLVEPTLSLSRMILRLML